MRSSGRPISSTSANTGFLFRCYSNPEIGQLKVELDWLKRKTGLAS
jgi:hypothetical protein